MGRESLFLEKRKERKKEFLLRKKKVSTLWMEQP
jgi:hypothetical protein